MDNADFDDLLSRVKEIQELLQFPSLSQHIGRANELALSVARNAPPPVPHLAMLLGRCSKQHQTETHGRRSARSRTRGRWAIENGDYV
jgi:hypothetical protein